MSHLVRTDLLVSTRSTYTSTSIHFMWSSWLFSNLYKELPQTSRCIYASWRSLVCRQLSTFDFGAHFQPAHFFSCTFISIVELAQVVNFVKLSHFEKFQWISHIFPFKYIRQFVLKLWRVFSAFTLSFTHINYLYW